MSDTHSILPPATNGAGLSVITFHPFAAASADAMDRWSLDNDYDMGDEIVSDKHPTPWRYEEVMESCGRDDCVDYAKIIDADGKRIALFDDDGGQPGKRIGHLMASAPTLLAQRDALLKALKFNADAWDELCDLLRADDFDGALEYGFKNAKFVTTAAGKAIAMCDEPETKP